MNSKTSYFAFLPRAKNSKSVQYPAISRR